MPGPPPIRPELRRRALVTERWRTIPRHPVRSAPAWPIDHTPPSSAELELWESLWQLPPATVWHEQHLARLVARHVMHTILVEGRDPSTRLLAEVRRGEEALLLTPAALARARILVDDDDQAAGPVAPPIELTRRRRLMAVDPITPKKKKAAPSG